MKYAEVAVNSPVVFPRTFSYTIPPHMSVGVGNAVWVPFGSRTLQGIVFELSAVPAVEETREIAEVVDSHPLLQRHQVELSRWISERYLSSLFEAAALMLPPGFERRLLTFIEPLPSPSEVTLASLTLHQRQVLDLLQRRGRVELRELKKALRRKEMETLLGQLLRKRLISKTQELARVKVKPRMVPYLRLAIEAEAAKEAALSLRKKRAFRQAELLEFLAAELQPVPLSQAKERLRCSAATVSSLIRKGLLTIEEVRVLRDPLAHRTFPWSSPPLLSPAQESAWQRIQASQKRGAPPVFLLHGVTGSGKTEIYLRAVAQAISLGKRALVLVPEIALTPQTINRFATRFPDRVAVLHSQLSMGEQYDEWQRIREGAFDVVIGSRGALFAPQPDLGLIVIDEEHEGSYKQQEPSPHYHARDVAFKLAELTGSVLILGSATPDLVSYYRAQNGEYQLLELPERIIGTASAGGNLPEVEVVDLRQELKEGNRSIFSRSLTRAMARALEEKEQVILFLNRRGAASFVQCRNCGFVLRCKRCEVALTYHSAEENLRCHHCNYRTPVPQRCPQCFSQRIRFFGIGTQRVAEEVARAFPQARLLRWDRDVTRGKRSHDEILESFLAHKSDVLIGTQMIAKGLDLPLVTLVGVVAADLNLHLPDFRAGERTFQLLTQVAGRAGRGPRGGRVIVQTYTPEHYAVAAAARHDYQTFYEREILYRRQQGNPPFARLARLLYTHTNASLCQREAERMHRLLTEEKRSRGLPNIDLLGPTPAFVPRVRGRFRWQIILRSPQPLDLLSDISFGSGWAVDIDPVHLL